MSVFSNVEFTKTDINHSKMMAEGTFVVGGAIKIKFLLFNGKNGLFPMLPSREYQKKDGTKGYDRQVQTLSRELSDELTQVVVDAWNELQNNTGSTDEPNPDFNDDNIPF